MADESRANPTAAAGGAQAQQRQPEFTVDATNLPTHYANFARVTGTPEELVLDFGLNTQMVPNAAEPVKLTHRLVLNFYTAKRLLLALNAAIQQHERVYGVLEIDVQKRIRGVPPGAQRPAGGPTS